MENAAAAAAARFLSVVEASDDRVQRVPGPRAREKRIGNRQRRTCLPPDDAEIQLAAAALFGGVVLIDHALDPALRIASGPLQILVRVGEFVLVQFLAALGEVELLREAFLLIFLCGRQEFRKARNVRVKLGSLPVRFLKSVR